MSKEQRRMDRFIVIPFSSTCRSGSSVDVVHARQGKKPQGGGSGEGAAGKPGKGESLLARLLKGFKNLSQIFAVYEEEDEEEEEQEMVIGLPTDVKHVAHIGWDGSTSTTTSVRSWNRAAPPPPDSASTSTSSTPAAAAPPPVSTQSLAPPLPPSASLSARQFQLAMAAQAAAAAASTSTTSTAARRSPRQLAKLAAGLARENKS